MVSESEKMNAPSPSGAFLRYEGEPIENFKTVRILFRKTGSLQYISHLDLQRVMMRILVRAGIPMWYTQGFNPHMKVVFARPLPVGVESECELMDLRISRDVPPEEILRRLNVALTDEMRAKDAYIPERKFEDIASCDYAISIFSDRIHKETGEAVENFLRTPGLKAVKKTGSGNKEVEISKHICRMNVISGEGKLEIYVNLPAAQDQASLSPLLICQLLFEQFGWFSDHADEDFRVVRLHMRDDRMREFK